MYYSVKNFGNSTELLDSNFNHFWTCNGFSINNSDISFIEIYFKENTKISKKSAIELVKKINSSGNKMFEFIYFNSTKDIVNTKGNIITKEL